MVRSASSNLPLRLETVVVPVTVEPVPAPAKRPLHALFEALEAILDVAGFPRIKAVPCLVSKPSVDLVGLVHQTVSGPAADRIVSVEPSDLPADVVDPHVQGPNFTPIALKTVPWLRVILSVCRDGGGKEGACRNEGKNERTHLCSLLFKKSGGCGELCAFLLDARLNEAVICRSKRLIQASL